MIKFLHVRNLATIEEVELSFADGFSILTGETGAGKSILIDSIRLLLGDKGPADLIRTGKSEATVEAIFRIGGSVPAGLESLAQDGEIALHRRIVEQGSGQCYAGGVLVPVKRLKEWSPCLVDIYGQNDHVFLLHLDNHLDYLDQFAETLPLREEVTGLARSLRKLLRDRKELESRQQDAAQRLDFLAYQIHEIEEASLRPGEEEELHRERHVLKHAEKIAGLVASALEITYDREESLSGLAGRLQKILDELGSFDAAFLPLGRTAAEVSITLGEMSDSLMRYRDREAQSPERLEAIEERLSLIEKLKRKYGTDIQDICYYYQKIRDERDALAHSQERLEALTREVGATFAEYTSQAKELTRRRVDAARDLERRVEKEIGRLGMAKARFGVRVVSTPVGLAEAEKARDTGLEEVEFLISPNPGEELRPLRKIASGGELSRVMLALKALGKDKGASQTLIFDEIDTGIGGRTAECVAQKLKDLSRRHQVLCITHLPQIASFAAHHYRIAKRVERDRTFTTVARLGFEERVEEIAGLISGSHITPASREHAREMLTRNLEDAAGPGG